MIISATELKNRLGKYINVARLSPVVVEKTGKPAVVLLSIEEFERLINTDNEFWTQKALMAEKSGYIGTEKSIKILTKKD